MLPAVLEEHALSLLEIQENVKGEEWIHRAPRQAYEREVRELASKLTA